MSTIWAFDNIASKYSLHSGEDCMKKFCITQKNTEKYKSFSISIEKEIRKVDRDGN